MSPARIAQLTLRTLLQRLQYLASTNYAAKTYLTQQHAQGPRLYNLLDTWQHDRAWTIAVLELLGALMLRRFRLLYLVWS